MLSHNPRTSEINRYRLTPSLHDALPICGIIYLALFNPDSNECEIGSIPSPSFDQSASGKDETINISNKIIGSETAGFQFESKFYKLFEPEKFEINPGDKYAIGYTIQPTTLNIFDKEQKCIN